MSDTTDYLDVFIWNDFDKFYNGYYKGEIWTLYQKGKLYWTKQDDTEILIQEMSYSHLMNLQNMLKSKDNNEATDEWLDVIEFELKKRDQEPEILPKFD